MRFDTYVGKRAPVNLTAVGKAIVAYLPEPELDEILRVDFRRGTERAPALPYDFKAQLRDFRELGYMVEDEEEVP
ncbi:MAG: IclR family transcriptional regulator, partial [Chloroflexi bacterium]|nr:IclR family transcriptional regulator [Chloroflexota bacterium]